VSKPSAPLTLACVGKILKAEPQPENKSISGSTWSGRCRSHQVGVVLDARAIVMRWPAPAAEKGARGLWLFECFEKGFEKIQTPEPKKISE
jgi:hypothetical protein